MTTSFRYSQWGGITVQSCNGRMKGIKCFSRIPPYLNEMRNMWFASQSQGPFLKLDIELYRAIHGCGGGGDGGWISASHQ